MLGSSSPVHRTSPPRRAPRWLLLAPLAAALVTASAAAAPIKDADAEKALKEAMDTDYFNTDFQKAEKKLRGAIDACGTTCSAGVKAKLYVGLGTVLAARKELADAQDAFVEALKLDPKAAPDPDLVSAELTFAFEKAKAELKIGTPASPPATHAAPAAQVIRTPVPLYLEVSPDALTAVRKVTGSYAGPGMSNFEPLSFRKIGERGYGAEVSCEDVAKEGELRYFITLLGEGDKEVAAFGSRAEPLRVPLRTKISSEAPRWPGFSPPEQCKAKVGEPQQCVDDRQCNAGLTCESGQCVASTKKEEGDKGFFNWITVTFAPDLALYSGKNVCSQQGQINDNYVCLNQDGSRYVGNPSPDQGNNVNLGFVLGTMRVAAQYDRVIWNNLTAGLRLGFAFNGATGEGSQFIPLHVEARVGYALGKNAFDGLGLRPFGFVSAGFAQVDARVGVEVLDNGEARRLSAYKQAGNGFATVGAGLLYQPVRRIGFHFALRGGVTFPVVIGVIAPEAGVSFGF